MLLVEETHRPQVTGERQDAPHAPLRSPRRQMLVHGRGDIGPSRAGTGGRSVNLLDTGGRQQAWSMMLGRTEAAAHQ
ncbi:hypothetical protein ACWGLP_33285 [Streptomyces lydicus]